MKQGQFEQLYQPLWHVMELEIIELEKKIEDIKLEKNKVVKRDIKPAYKI